MKLSSLRLKTLAAYYHQVESIWDIGCDHGILGLSFLQNESVTRIHLVDPSVDVIRSLNKKLIDSYITKKHLIRILHAKGQDLILGQEPKLVFIAGMGGKEIQEIIKCLLPQLNIADRLVISPHRNILELRKYLHSSPLKLADEMSVFEDGQFYQVLCLQTSPELPNVSLFGEKVWQGLYGEEYRQHQLRSFNLHQDDAAMAFVAYLRQLSH